jgi:hypothetical protein
VTARLLLAFSLCLARPAWSNGGPVAWTSPTAVGDGAPVERSPVRLVSEDLRLRVDPDRVHYDVQATYTLSNPGTAATVRYAVPVTWGFEEDRPADGDLAAVATGVKLLLDGVAVRTTYERAEEGAELTAAPDFDPLPLSGWCVTTLTVGPGAHTLSLVYRAELSYMDGETSKSALTGFGERNLLYPLWPAGGWAGPSKLDVTLELGSLADAVGNLVPAGAKVQGTARVFHWDTVDLAKLSGIGARLDIAPFMKHQQIASWNSGSSYAVTATASSTLAGGKYEAIAAVDGKPDSAWCEGAADTGAGQWIELRGRPGSKPAEYCGIEGLGVVPGYAKSADTWVNNGRVKKVKVGACGSELGQVVDLGAPDPHHDRSARVIDLSDMGEPGPEIQALGDRFRQDPLNFCVRVTVLEVQAGTKYADTCLSELALIINCG